MAQFITGAGFAGTIGGAVTVYGTAERQTITVADVKGTVTFDPSFNRGGDTIVFTKPASSYVIAQSGSTVILTTNDNQVIVPVGTTAITLQFADGDRSLIYSGSFKLGDQIVNSTSASITALGSTKSALSLDTSTQAARLVLNQETVSVGGNVTVYGTLGSEAVSIAGGGQITFDPSFNKGGDTISLAKSASNYTAQRSGSSVLLKSSDNTISIPVGTVGATVDFAGDKKTVIFADGAFKVGSEISTATASKLSTSPRIFSFQKIVSDPVQNAFLNWEALSVADINGDKKLDVVMANGAGGLFTALKPTDPPTTILLNDGSNRLTKLDTSSLKPTGWVNDWVIFTAPDGGNPYVLGIDHSRESGPNNSFEAKMKMPIYRIENGKVVDYTDLVKNNIEDWRHAANQIGDLNKDGIIDFVVANSNMDQGFTVYYGDKRDLFIKQDFDKYTYWNSPNSVGITGAIAMLDIGGDGDLDFITLPYIKAYGEHRNAEMFIYENGALSSVKTFLAKAPEIADNNGYSFTAVADLNGDGLADIAAVLEVSGASKNMIAIMLQNKSGSFDVTYFPTSEFQGHADSKIQLYDMDGDGDLDLYYGGSLKNTVSDLSRNLFLNDGNGRFELSEVKNQSIFKDVTWQGYARTFIADFNKDGLGDILVLQESFVSNVQTVTPMVFLNSGYFI